MSVPCSSPRIQPPIAAKVYPGDLENCSIVRYEPDGSTKIVIADERLVGPDSNPVTGDGHLYVSCSQIQNMPWFNDGESRRVQPSTVYRMKTE